MRDITNACFRCKHFRVNQCPCDDKISLACKVGDVKSHGIDAYASFLVPEKCKHKKKMRKGSELYSEIDKAIEKCIKENYDSFEQEYVEENFDIPLIDRIQSFQYEVDDMIITRLFNDKTIYSIRHKEFSPIEDKKFVRELVESCLERYATIEEMKNYEFEVLAKDANDDELEARIIIK